MNAQMFAQAALGLKFLDLEKRSNLESFFYKLPESKKMTYIQTMSEAAEGSRNSIISFFRFAHNGIAYQLRDSPPDT